MYIAPGVYIALALVEQWFERRRGGEFLARD